MTSINLYQKSSPAEEINRSRVKFFDSGMVFGIAIVVISLLTWGGLVFWTKNLQSQIDAVKSNTTKEKNVVALGEEIDAVADFSLRSEAIVKALDSKKFPSAAVSALESSVADGVVFETLGYDKGNVSLKARAGSYQSLAKQILLIKNDKRFSNVSVNSVSRDDAGIAFGLSFLFSEKK